MSGANYVDYDYWDYGYCVGDIRAIEYGSADINASISLTINGGVVYSSEAAITVTGTVFANGARIQLSGADITAFSSVTALGGVVFNGVTDINAKAVVTASAFSIRTGNADINAFLSVTVNGEVLGKNWITSSVSSDTWTVIPDSALLRYVIPDYWEEEYVLEKEGIWTDTKPVENKWLLH